MHTGGVPDQNKEQCGREQELKNMFKRNQVMITALAIMIAVAGYCLLYTSQLTIAASIQKHAAPGRLSDLWRINV